LLTLDELDELAGRFNVFPIISESFNSSETPMGIFRKLQSETGVFLLESAEQGVWSRYSFIGFNPRGELIESEGKSQWTGPDLSFELSEDPLVALEQISDHYLSADNSKLPLQSGLVGHMSWNVVRNLERLPAEKQGQYSIPRIHFLQFREIVVLDHLDSKLYIIHNIFLEDGELQASLNNAESRISKIQGFLDKPTPAEIYDVDFMAEDDVQINMQKSEFLEMVGVAKEHVIAGDVFQVVVSQRFSQDIDVTADQVYAVLRALNPSPYMYLLQLADRGSGED
jgi:anthranilate synthase component 1